VDPFQKTQWHNIGVENLKRVGFWRHCKLIAKPSHVALPEVLGKHGEGSFDVVLVDGMHLFDYTLVDAFYAVKLLRPGGYLLVDDMWMKSVQHVVSYLAASYKGCLKRVPGLRTMAVFQKTGADERDWDHDERILP
jgi:predicted O-methyltransferase YrrM